MYFWLNIKQHHLKKVTILIRFFLILFFVCFSTSFALHLTKHWFILHFNVKSTSIVRFVCSKEFTTTIKLRCLIFQFYMLAHYVFLFKWKKSYFLLRPFVLHLCSKVRHTTLDWEERQHCWSERHTHKTQKRTIVAQRALWTHSTMCCFNIVSCS